MLIYPKYVSEEPYMTMVLFNTKINVIEILIYSRYVVRGARHDQDSV